MSRNRPFVAADNVGRPCNCLECQAAGVTDLPIVKVPPDEFHARSRWLHGEALKSLHAARTTALDGLAELRRKLSAPQKPEAHRD